MLCMDYAAGLLSVRPSVRPSVTRRYLVEAAKHILKLFSPSGSHTILVFLPHQTLWQYSDGDLLTGALKAGCMKKSRFSTNISLCLANDTRQSLEGE